MNRKFDSSNPASDDAPAKQAIIRHYRLGGWKHIKEEEQYSKYDLHFYKDGIDVFLELEHRNEFSGPDIPFKTIHMPKRKEKSDANYYIVITQNYDYAWVISMDLAKKAKTVSINCQNEFSNGMEDFFDIPVVWFRRIKLLR